MSTINQLLLDIIDIIDQDVVDTYQQMNQQTIEQVKLQSDTEQYEYILQLVAYLNRIKSLFEEQLEEHINNDYETIIQNLEASIRTHIRIEQQQKLQIESLMQKIEEISNEKDSQIKDQVEKIKSLEHQLRDFQSKINSSIDIHHKKSPSAFDRLNKLVSNKSQKNLYGNDANFKSLIKIYNCEKLERSISKGRKQHSACRDNTKTLEDAQNNIEKCNETERIRELHSIIDNKKRNNQKQITDQQLHSVSTEKIKYKLKGSPLIKPEQQLQSQSFDQVGRNLMILQKQISNRGNQTSQLLKFLQKK